MRRLGWLVVIGGVLLLVGWGRGSGIMGGFGFPMMGMMGLGMLLFWVLIIGGVVGLAGPFVRSLSGRSIPSQGESPFEILKKRYARGDITKEQFEAMKRDLGI